MAYLIFALSFFVSRATFNPATIKEATRHGMPAEALIGKAQPAKKLAKLDLVVKNEMVQMFEVDEQ